MIKNELGDNLVHFFNTYHIVIYEKDMNELNNFVISNGNYDNKSVCLKSNTLIVSLIDGLAITRSADKLEWNSGNLTYTIVLNNKTNTSYVNPSVVDIFDNNLIDFVTGSVTIKGSKMSQENYDYDNNMHTLVIRLDNLTANSETTIAFSVKRKGNRPFRLISDCTLYYGDNLMKKSNKVIVTAGNFVYSRRDNYDCKAPFWRV